MGLFRGVDTKKLMMNAPRMNLFRVFGVNAKTSPKPSFGQWAIVTVVVFVFGIFTLSWWRFHRHSNAFKKSISDTKLVLDQMEKLRQTLDSGHKVRGLELGSLGSWTDFLWKLSHSMSAEVVIKKLELGGGSVPSKTADLKKVSIEGEAQSVITVKIWLNQLVVGLPQYSVTIDHQEVKEGSDFPVQFKVTMSSS